jgi:hypothetical protein
MGVVVRATQDAKAEDEGRIRLMLQIYRFFTLTPTLSLKEVVAIHVFSARSVRRAHKKFAIFTYFNVRTAHATATKTSLTTPSQGRGSVE